MEGYRDEVIMVNIVKIIMCHAIGDYLFQSSYLADNKGKNWYLLIIHCILYCVPFAFCFGIDARLIILFGAHVIIDALKARYKKIDLLQDQILHYAIAGCFYLC